MATAAAEFESAGPNLREYLEIISRRRAKMLVAFGSGLIISVLLVTLLPASYQSTATILIEQQELPTDLVRSTVTSYADQRVQVIGQRVMTTQNLLDIIRRYNLYPRDRERESREALIKRMRADTAVKMISAEVIDPRSGRPTSATIAFSVAYSNRSPEQAARVANELTTLFLNENLTSRTRLAEEAQTFLESEADRVSHHIEELEAQLATFKAKHLETLPELVQLNMSLLDRTQQAIEAIETRKSSLEQQLVYLQAQLVQLKPNSVMISDSGERILSPADRLRTARSELASARALYAPEHPDIGRLQREIAGLEADADEKLPPDLNDLRRSLEVAKGAAAEASQRYSSDHPDRIRLEHQVATLEDELAAATRATALDSSKKVAANATADNPAYIQIQAQVSATRNDLESLAAEQARLRTQMSEYQHNVTVSPQIEREYRELTRDYDNSRLKYQELRSKAGEATVARNLETDRKGERFTLIEPPLVPQEPVSPNRLLIGIFGFLISIGLAIGAAAALEALDGTIRGRRDLQALLGGIPPLAIIPQIEFDDEAPAHPWRRLLIMAVIVVALLVLILSVIHVFYRPLDVLWFVGLRKLGIG